MVICYKWASGAMVACRNLIAFKNGEESSLLSAEEQARLKGDEKSCAWLLVRGLHGWKSRPSPNKRPTRQSSAGFAAIAGNSRATEPTQASADSVEIMTSKNA